MHSLGVGDTGPVQSMIQPDRRESFIPDAKTEKSCRFGLAFSVTWIGSAGPSRSQRITHATTTISAASSAYAIRSTNLCISTFRALRYIAMCGRVLRAFRERGKRAIGPLHDLAGTVAAGPLP